MSIFAYRGPLEPGHPLFRGRETELARLSHLCLGEVETYAIVYGGHQTGKTSLLLRFENLVSRPDWTCRVDFQGLPGAATSEIYAYLARRIAHTLCWSKPTPETRNAPDLTDFLCEAISQSGTGRFVLLLEELGALPQASREDLAHVLRATFNSRFDASCRPLARLFVVLAGGIELYDLAATQVSPLQNICEAFYLSDLDEHEAVGLVVEGLTKLGLQTDQAVELGTAIYSKAEGHPYLTQRLGGILEEHLANGQLLNSDVVETAVEELLHSDQYFRRLHRTILEERLLSACIVLLDGSLRFSRFDEEMARLELLGIAKEDRGNWKTRNTLLSTALHTWTSLHPSRKPSTAHVALLTRVLPTAYCRHLDAAAFPLVTVTLDNSGEETADFTVRATVESYSDTATASAQIASDERQHIVLLPLLQSAALVTLNEIRPATLRITIEQTFPVSRTLYDCSERIHLHARDTALLAVQSPDGSTVDLTDYLAAWVTPHRSEIEQLLRRAADHHPERQIRGYQDATTPPERAASVRAQAQAIFATLKEDARLVYVNSTLSLGAEAGQITQRVRLPSESLAAGGSANCIDGAVLFASLLELASLDPLIVLVPGHAFIGWRAWKGIDRYEFLETTLIGYADFDAAQESAQASYDEALVQGYFKRALFDPAGFARLIDVADCREKGIHPLE